MLSHDKAACGEEGVLNFKERARMRYSMTTADLVRVYEKNLLALDAHARKVSMDDSKHIRLVRVLIETAETLMEEMGKSESKIEATAWELTDYARSLYINSCLEAYPEISNKDEFAEESGEMFDYVFQHGAYPDE